MGFEPAQIEVCAGERARVAPAYRFSELPSHLARLAAGPRHHRHGRDFKVRENLTSYADPGWYQPPPGMVAQVASKQDLEREGITTGSPARQPSPREPPMMNMPGMKH